MTEEELTQQASSSCHRRASSFDPYDSLVKEVAVKVAQALKTSNSPKRKNRTSPSRTSSAVQSHAPYTNTNKREKRFEDFEDDDSEEESEIDDDLDWEYSVMFFVFFCFFFFFLAHDSFCLVLINSYININSLLS